MSTCVCSGREDNKEFPNFEYRNGCFIAQLGHEAKRFHVSLLLIQIPLSHSYIPFHCLSL